MVLLCSFDVILRRQSEISGNWASKLCTRFGHLFCSLLSRQFLPCYQSTLISLLAWRRGNTSPLSVLFRNDKSLLLFLYLQLFLIFVTRFILFFLSLFLCYCGVSRPVRGFSHLWTISHIYCFCNTKSFSLLLHSRFSHHLILLCRSVGVQIHVLFLSWYWA